MPHNNEDGQMDTCSFCGLPRTEVEVMFSGSDGANICDKCIEHGHNLLVETEVVSKKQRRPKFWSTH